EREGMAKSVLHFDCELAGEIVRSVTVIANGDRSVAGLRPSIELLFHHVAVRARFRIVREVGRPARVEKWESTQAGHEPDRETERNRCGRQGADVHFTVPPWRRSNRSSLPSCAGKLNDEGHRAAKVTLRKLPPAPSTARRGRDRGTCGSAVPRLERRARTPSRGNIRIWPARRTPVVPRASWPARHFRTSGRCAIPFARQGAAHRARARDPRCSWRARSARASPRAASNRIRRSAG